MSNLAGATLLLVLIGAATLYLPPGEFVLGGWDAGVYFNTGVALATTGGFVVPDPLLAAAGPAAQEALVKDNYLQPGFYWDATRGALVTQFPFLLAVLAGAAVLAGGPGAGLYVPVLAGLLAVLAFSLFAWRVGGPVTGVAAGALLAFNALQLWHARLSLAEEMVQLFLFGGLWAGLVWRETGARAAAAAAGLALGLLPLVKTEAALLGALGCLAVLWGPPAHARRFLAPFFGVSLLAAGHYVTLANPVASGQLARAWPLAALALGLALALLVMARLRVNAGVGACATCLVAVLVVGPPDLGFLSALWTGLYLTPLEGVLLAVAPVVLFARGLWAGDKHVLSPVEGPPPYVWPVTAALVAGAAFYLLLFHHYYAAQERIPLFLWGARRLVPVVLPLAVLAEAFALAWLAGRLVPGLWRTSTLAAAVVLLIALRVPDLAAIREDREYHGALNAVATIAARVEPDGVVLVAADDAGVRFAAPLRFVTGRATYLLREGARPDGVRDLITAAGAEGRPVYYLAPSSAPEGLPGHMLEPRGGWRFQLPELERTSERRPARWLPFTADLSLFRVGTLAQ